MRKDRKTVFLLKDMYFPNEKEIVVKDSTFSKDDPEELTGYNALVPKIYKKIGEGGEVLEKPEEIVLFQDGAKDVPEIKSVIHETTKQLIVNLEDHNRATLLKVLQINFPEKYNSSASKTQKREVYFQELSQFSPEEIGVMFEKAGIVG